MTNPYPEQVMQCIAEMPADGLALEVGSGGRFIEPRVIGMEITPCPTADLLGDVLDLPFGAEVFDFVFSQAVLEHVKDPQRAVDEMVRVLKPGGVFYCEVAFMQPVHQAPIHFFNHTRYGIAYVCRELEEVRLSPIGRFDEAFRWWAEQSGAGSVLGSLALDAIVEKLEPVHDHSSWDQKLNGASGIAYLGMKRVS